MTTFGFSAYLKLISMNDRPQRRAVRERLTPRDGGYDFHKTLKTCAHSLLVENAPVAEVMKTIANIKKAAERRSALNGITRLIEWREANPSAILGFSNVTYESPNAIFKVNFTPNFGMQFGERTTAVHIWNTINPPLTARAVYSALALFPTIYEAVGNAPDDLAVLSLRTSELHRLSTSSDHAFLGRAMANRIEALFRSVRDELGLPSVSRHDEPSPPAFH